VADAAFTSRPDSGMGAFYAHVNDVHLNPHPQYRLAETDLTQTDVATGFRLHAASASAPSSPSRGDTWVDTDTMELFVYYGATTGWARPWNLPWGYVAVATQSSDVTSIGTGGSALMQTGLFTPMADRRYRVTAKVRFASASVGLVAFAALEYTSGGTDLDVIGASLEATTSQVTVPLFYQGSLTAASNTLRVVATTSTGTMTAVAGATYEARILVEDIGSTGSAPVA
jgi:hypothetical protein